MYYCRYQEYIIAVTYVVSRTLPKFMPHQEQSKALSYGVLVIIILPSQLSYLNNFYLLGVRRFVCVGCIMHTCTIN